MDKMKLRYFCLNCRSEGTCEQKYRFCPICGKSFIKDQSKEKSTAATVEGKTDNGTSPVPVSLVVKDPLVGSTVAELTSILGGKGVTVSSGLEILDACKEVITKCTVIQSNYNV